MPTANFTEKTARPLSGLVVENIGISMARVLQKIDSINGIEKEEDSIRLTKGD